MRSYCKINNNQKLHAYFSTLCTILDALFQLYPFKNINKIVYFMSENNQEQQSKQELQYVGDNKGKG